LELNQEDVKLIDLALGQSPKDVYVPRRSLGTRTYKLFDYRYVISKRSEKSKTRFLPLVEMIKERLSSCHSREGACPEPGRRGIQGSLALKHQATFILSLRDA